MKLVVCEDGNEYSERFRRFLGEEFEFVRAANFGEALKAAAGARGLLLDLDFRRTDPSLLVDESGAPASRAAAEVQGILILRALRSRGVKLPALLFADLDDRERAARLETELAPLEILSSSEGLPRIADRLRKLPDEQRDR
ncbi:MAG: hypothetical protein ABR567_15510 [Myxococcales bacterium]|nr:hypothetical protein [Myxococcales bacterium]